MNIKNALENLSCFDDDGNIIYEEWKPIINFETLYEISNFGRVKRLPRKYRNSRYSRILKPIKQKNGYYYVGLTDNKKISTRYRIHILVAKYFIPNPENLPEVNHKFGDKSDNRLHKLEWSTRQHNIDHSIMTGLTLQKGEDSPNAILSNEQALFIFKSDIRRSDLCRMFNINKSVISFIKTGRTYSCVTGKKYNPNKRKISL